ALVLMAMAIAVVAILFTIVCKPLPGVIWNLSESAPVGLYRAHASGKLAVGDLVIAMPPEPVATFLADGGYLPSGVPLLKRVAALSGQIVCRKGAMISVDGVKIGTASERDRHNRLLPVR